MDLTLLGQLYKADTLSKKQKLELARKINVHYCIPNDVCRNLRDKSSYNCLHIAALNLDHDFILEFVSRGADLLKQGTQDGQTPVHVALKTKENSKRRKVWEISGKLQECQVVNTLLEAHVKSNNPSNPKCKNGLSHLHIACMFNCVEAVKFFLKNGEPINQVTNVNAPWPSYTPLHFAIRYSSIETVEYLLNDGADLLAEDAQGTTSLHILINRLLNVADYVNMGQYAICVPYEEELVRLERMICVVIKLKSEENVNSLDETGLTTFHLACLLRNTSVLVSFLKDNFHVNMPVKVISKFWPGWTPLHFASCTNVETVELLIQKGADITVKNEKREIPLDFCLKRFIPETLHSILSTKDEFKNILLSDSFNTLLDLLLAMNDPTSFEDFLRSIKQINVSVSPESPLLPGCNILHLALLMNQRKKSWNDFLEETDTRKNVNIYPKNYNNAYNNDKSGEYFDRISACLASDCSVSFKNCDGLTPIHLAFKHLVRPDVLQMLLNYCQRDMIDPDNLSHLHIACATGNSRAVRTLLPAAGANVNTKVKKRFHWYEKSEYLPNKVKPRLIRINSKSTPLHVAVVFGHSSIIEILLQFRANPFATDSEKFTPIHMSLVNSSNEIAAKIVSIPEELVEVITTKGLSHLHVAAFAGDANAIEKLLCNGGIVNSRIGATVPDFLSRFAGKTSLEITTQISEGNVVKAVEVLVQSGADIYNNDTLQCLMTENYADFGQYFVDRLKINENVRSSINSSGLTLLHIACDRVDLKWATKLIHKGANVNARIRSDEDYKGHWKGYTPLHVLILRKNFITDDYDINSKKIKLGELLLKSGADFTIDSKDGTVLHILFHDYIKKELSCARIRRPTSYLQQQPEAFQIQQFHSRVRPRCQPMLEPILVEQPRIQITHNRLMVIIGEIWQYSLASSMLNNYMSWKINPIDSDGFSHFHFSCMADKPVVVNQFLDNGVDVNHTTNPFLDTLGGYTALHLAGKYGAFGVVDVLIEHGADLNAENADGNTLLHLMVEQNFIDSQRPAIFSLKKHGANFSAKNLNGETPADILLSTKFLSLELLKFLVDNGSSISLVKNNSIPGPAALIMQNALPTERMEMMKFFIALSDLQAAAKIGYSPIQDIAKIRNDHYASDDYLHVVLELVHLDCKIDQRDEKGFTALNNAIAQENMEAIYALIQVGADLSFCNVDRQELKLVSALEIKKCFMLQVHKMHKLRLNVNSDCEYLKYRNWHCIDRDMEMNIERELEIADSVKFAGKLTARSFLTELWGIVYYTSLPPVHRQTIDAFFKNIVDLLMKFPLFCGLMVLQYRKALHRPKLIESAKGVLLAECKFQLPDLCLECILNYVTNDEIKYLIQHSGKIENLSKRQRTN